MANEENLIPQNRRTKREQREIASKGGKKSGEARRDRKKFKEAILDILKQPVPETLIEECPYLAGSQDIQAAMVAAMVSVVLSGGKGASSAFIALRDTIGEKPVEKQATTDSEGNDIIAPIKLEIAPVEVVHDKTSETS